MASSLGARQQFEAGKRGSQQGGVQGCGPSFAPIFLKAAIMDGREGFTLAVSNAEGTYYSKIPQAHGSGAFAAGTTPLNKVVRPLALSRS